MKPTVRMVSVAVDVSAALVSGCRTLRGDLFLPEQPTDGGVVFVCIPGGGCNRSYFDLCVGSDSETFSMARHIAGSGHVVMSLDPPGVGDSDVPDDGYDLSPEIVSDILALAVRAALDRYPSELGLTSDGHTPGLVGLGHSAGALLVAYQQARHASYSALVLLGFSASGLPQVLHESELEYAERPTAFAAIRREMTERRFGEPLPMWTNSSDIPDSADAPKAEIEDALSGVNARLIACVGMTAIIPGAVQPQLDVLTAPIFAAMGERDLAGELNVLPGQLPSCGDLTLFLARGAGHSHNIAPSRQELWTRIERWSESL